MHAELENGRLLVYNSYLHRHTLGQIPGRRWLPDRKAWSIPLNTDSVETLGLIGCERRPAKTQSIPQEYAELEPPPLNVKLYQHQRSGYGLACEAMGIFSNTVMLTPGYALLMEMGCGKTITAIGIAGRAFMNQKCQRLLVAAPKSILGVWKAEFEKFAAFPYSLTILQGSSAKKCDTLKRLPTYGLQVVVVNYESVVLIEKALLVWGPDFIICDESTKIKNPTAKMSKTLYRLSKRAAYRLILTGTPVQNNPLDFFSQYKFLDDRIFGTSYYAFKSEYAVLGTYNELIGWRNLPELVRKAHSIAYRVTKAEALDLPEVMDEIRPVLLEDTAMKKYRKFQKDSYMELSQGEVTATNVLTHLLRLQQITGGFVRPDENNERYEQVSRAKLEALADIVDAAVSEKHKLVVIARFTVEIETICRMLEQKGLVYTKVSGTVKDRSEQVERFQTDPECMVFVGQIQTVSMGLTLTAASTMVFYSWSYNYADYSQARARIHRIGQQNNCLYIHLVVPGTVDETILSALKQKENIAVSVVDNWKELLQ